MKKMTLGQIKIERDAWMETAKLHAINQEYHRKKRKQLRRSIITIRDLLAEGAMHEDQSGSPYQIAKHAVARDGVGP